MIKIIVGINLELVEYVICIIKKNVSSNSQVWEAFHEKGIVIDFK